MKGITLLELLIVISIFAILIGAASPFLSRFYLQSNLDTTVDMLVSTVRKAQSYSMDQKNGSSWGVCVNGSNLRLFQGTCNAPTINEDYGIPGNITVSGLPSITFSTGRGEPTATFSATVSSQIGSHTVQVNTAGALTIN